MKASSMGEYIPALFNFDKNEKIVYLAATDNYSGFMVFAFESGRVAKVDMKSYFTKTNRKKLIKAYFEDEPLVECEYLQKDEDIVLKSSSGKIVIFNTSELSLKQTKNTQGIIVMKQKKGCKLTEAKVYVQGSIEQEEIYKVKKIPSTGKLPQNLKSICEQMTLE